jgi:hypothetical protein
LRRRTLLLRHPEARAKLVSQPSMRRLRRLACVGEHLRVTVQHLSNPSGESDENR